MICAAGAIVLWPVARLQVVMIPVCVVVTLAALSVPLVELLSRRLPRLLARERDGDRARSCDRARPTTVVTAVGSIA